LGELGRPPLASLCMERAPLSIAVLVPTLRRPEDLERCLAGLAAQARRPDRVVVVTRPDDHATHAALARVPIALPLDVVSAPRPGQVAALNAGLAAVREDVVAITDDDGVPRPDWLARIGERFERDPGAGAVGGRDWVRHGTEPVEGEERTVGRVTWYGRFLGFHHLGAGPAREVDFLKGANMAYRRAALPGFDGELRGRGAEHHNDWAASLHVKRLGWRVVYDPAIAIDHYEGDRGGLDPRLPSDRAVVADRVHNQTYAAVRYLPGRKAAAHLLFVVLIGTTVAPGIALALRDVARGEPLRAALAALWAGLRGRAAGVRTALRAGRV
jgi:GT2 family glycosyltransferase